MKHPFNVKLSFLACLLVHIFYSFPLQAQFLNEWSSGPGQSIHDFNQNALPPEAGSTLSARLDQTFDSLFALSNIRGMSAAIQLQDGTTWERAAGLSVELPASLPLTTDHLMGMGSITKSFVATAILMLVEEGWIQLNDNIGQYLPAYPNVPADVTIRELLNHRSGISDYLNENPASLTAWALHPDSIWIADTILHHYVLEPNFPVGNAWAYSNTNYLLAGLVIESVTGKPWYQVIRERILDPLELTHTFVFPWESPGTQPVSHGWLDFDNNGNVDDVQGLGIPVEGLFSLAGSAGCMLTTPADLVRFHERLHGGHLLNPATLAEMHTDYVVNPAFGLKYGLGAAAFTLPQNLENWGHNGRLIYNSFALYFPGEQMALAVQQNDSRLNDGSGNVFDVYDMFVALLQVYLDETSVTSTLDLERNPGFTVFPNPVRNGQIHIQFETDQPPVFPVPFRLSSTSGQVVLADVIRDIEGRIHTENLVPGLYTLEMMGYPVQIIVVRP